MGAKKWQRRRAIVKRVARLGLLKGGIWTKTQRRGGIGVGIWGNSVSLRQRPQGGTMPLRLKGQREGQARQCQGRSLRGHRGACGF